MRQEWARRIDRARQLAEADPATSALLRFYARVLTWQGDLDAGLHARGAGLAGSLDADVPLIAPFVPALLDFVASHGPASLAAEATHLQEASSGELEDALVSWWRAPADRQFFPKAILQPYAHCLAANGIAPAGRSIPKGPRTCPFCGGRPQLGVITGSSALDSSGRQLVCATCLTPWPYQRVVCAQCAEDDERKLSYFRSPQYEHLRVDVCETCRHYLKSVDLTKLGLAVPLVDEVAGAALDVWAREQGYEKTELNLVGL